MLFESRLVCAIATAVALMPREPSQLHVQPSHQLVTRFLGNDRRRRDRRRRPISAFDRPGPIVGAPIVASVRSSPLGSPIRGWRPPQVPGRARACATVPVMILGTANACCRSSAPAGVRPTAKVRSFPSPAARHEPRFLKRAEIAVRRLPVPGPRRH